MTEKAPQFRPSIKTQKSNETTNRSETQGEGGETHQHVTDGQRLTTAQGIPVSDNQNSLKTGPRGPTLLEDFLKTFIFAKRCYILTRSAFRAKTKNNHQG